MKCPACESEIDLVKVTQFSTWSFFKHAQTCPYCNTTIHRNPNKTWEYCEQLLFVFVLIGIVLLLLAIIFGRHVGFKTALTASLYLGAVVAGIFLVIFSLNLIYVFLKQFLLRMRKDKN